MASPASAGVGAMEAVAAVTEGDGDAAEEGAALAARGDVLPLVNQVGGHRAATAEEPPYMLRLRPHFVLKIVQGGPRGDRELGFYRRLFPSSSSSSPDGGRVEEGEGHPLAVLRSFVPAFHGVRMLRSPPHLPEAPLVPYMVLEDISDRDRHRPASSSSSSRRRRRRRRRESSNEALPDGEEQEDESGGQRPSVLDVKMGRATHGPFASPNKAARERGKYPHQATVGFRIIGMKVYDRESGQYAVEGKAYGRGLAPEEVDDALARFFLRRCPHSPCPGANGNGNGGGNGRRRNKRRRAAASELLGWYIARLEALHAWFQRQHLARFWSSSLLFVDHEEAAEASDDSDSDDDDAEEEAKEKEKDDGDGDGRHCHPAGDVRMIDFAHVELRDGNGGSEGERAEAEDGNYLFGLVSLLEHLRRLRARAVALEAAEAGTVASGGGEGDGP